VIVIASQPKALDAITHMIRRYTSRKGGVIFDHTGFNQFCAAWLRKRSGKSSSMEARYTHTHRTPAVNARVRREGPVATIGAHRWDDKPVRA
jgi:hypothetical protein